VIEAAHQVEQGRLSRARRSGHGHELPALDFEGDAAQRGDAGLLAFTALVLVFACWRIRRLEVSYTTA